MDANLVVNIVLAAATLLMFGANAVLVWQTRKQIKLGNKNALFDKRIEVIREIRELDARYVSNSEALRRLTKDPSSLSDAFDLLDAKRNANSLAADLSGFSAGADSKRAIRLRLKDLKFRANVVFEPRCAKVFTECVDQYENLLDMLERLDEGRQALESGRDAEVDLRLLASRAVDTLDSLHKKMNSQQFEDSVRAQIML